MNVRAEWSEDTRQLAKALAGVSAPLAKLASDATAAPWDAFIHSPDGWRYIARRVIAGSRALLAETLRLERWLRARAPFNHTRGEDDPA